MPRYRKNESDRDIDEYNDSLNDSAMRIITPDRSYLRRAGKGAFAGGGVLGNYDDDYAQFERPGTAEPWWKVCLYRKVQDCVGFFGE